MHTSFQVISSTALAALILATTGGTALAAPVPTNLPGVTAIVDVPAGIDPLRATPKQLAAAFLPPRPDVRRDPNGFASWQRAVTSGAHRILPVLQQTDIKHKPRVPSPIDNASSSNWSGYALVNNSVSSYGGTSFYYLIADFVQPVAQQAYGACTGSWDYSSAWVGIDGYNNDDVLQAGTEADAYCSGGSTASYYSPWYEWYPNGETRITNLPVAPGDDLFVEVWSTGSTTGNAYIVNYTTDQSVQVQFTAPSGTTLVGNSAEFIVERPGVDGGLATLSNYLQDFWEDTYAYNFSYDPSAPGKTYSGVTSVSIKMLDNNGHAISKVTRLGVDGLFFQDEGSAE